MSNRLAEILSKSKAVMQKAEENHGSTSMNSGGGNMFSSQEKEIPNLTENYINNNRFVSIFYLFRQDPLHHHNKLLRCVYHSYNP